MIVRAIYRPWLGVSGTLWDRWIVQYRRLWFWVTLVEANTEADRDRVLKHAKESP